ncbi:MAG: PAS domain S-box protein [Bacteroidota bacterium]|nr:PAS domain S-box protein [Bacteroidota bacterium]
MERNIAFEELNGIINIISDPLFVKDREHRWIIVNDALCHLVKHTREEMLSKSDYDFFPKHEADNLWQKDEQVFLSGVDNTSEETITDSNNIIHIISTKKSLFTSSNGDKFIVGIFRDITQIKSAEIETLESKRKLTTLIDNLPGIVYRCKNDKDWTMEFISEGCFELTGYKAEDIIDNKIIPFNNIISEEYREFLWSKWQKVLQEHRKFSDSYVIVRADGERRHVFEWGCGVYDNKGNVVALEGFITDITEKVTTEEALRKSKAMLKQELDSILVPDIEIKDEDLKNILNTESLQLLLEDFSNLTNMGSAFLDLKGTVLAAAGWKDICTKFHRVNPESAKNCTESDLFLSGNVENGKCVVYKCKNNLWDVITPLIIGNKHVGNIYTGQFFYSDEEIDNNTFLTQAEKYGFDKDEYMKAVSRVPRYDKEHLDFLMSFLTRLSSLISRISYSNLKLTKAIVDQQEINAALRESKEKYSRIVNNANEGIWAIDSEDNTVFVNKRLTEILGFSAEEMMGRNYNSFMFVEDNDDIELKHKSRLQGIDETYERRLKHKDGRTIWTNISAATLWDNNHNFTGSFAMVTDITNIKKAENEIKIVHQVFENIIEFLPDATFVIDKERKVIAWNRALEEMTGVKKKDILGKGNYAYAVPFYGERRPIVIDLIGSSDTQSEKLYDVIKRNGDKIYTEIFVPSLYNGKGAYVSGLASPLYDNNGNLYGAIESVRDITEKKMYEKEIIAAKEKAERSEKLKTEFLAQMSHEIRTPINTMLNYIQLVQEDFPLSKDAEENDYFDAIEQAGERIIRTIDLILNTAELQTGSYECVYRETRLFENILKRIYRELKSKAQKKNLQLILIESKDEYILKVDQYSIEQIFINLIDNAIKYTPSGKIKINVFIDGTGKLSVNISDTGIGIAKEYLPYLFTPFTQEEQGYTRKFEGNGLGLSLVKRYCEMNNADISVRSKKGKGSVFTVSFSRYKTLNPFEVSKDYITSSKVV